MNTKANDIYFVALVYENQISQLLRSLAFKASNRDEALIKTINYFSKETEGFELIMITTAKYSLDNE